MEALQLDCRLPTWNQGATNHQPFRGARTSIGTHWGAKQMINLVQAPYATRFLSRGRPLDEDSQVLNIPVAIGAVIRFIGQK